MSLTSAYTGFRIGGVADNIPEADPAAYAKVVPRLSHRLQCFQVAVNIREYGGAHGRRTGPLEAPMSDLDTALAGYGIEHAIDEGVGLVTTIGLGQFDGFVDGDSCR